MITLVSNGKKLLAQPNGSYSKFNIFYTSFYNEIYGFLSIIVLLGAEEIKVGWCPLKNPVTFTFWKPFCKLFYSIYIVHVIVIMMLHDKIGCVYETNKKEHNFSTKNSKKFTH